MTDESYIKRLDDIRRRLGSLWCFMTSGNVSGQGLRDELAGMQSDLAFILDELDDHDIDELVSIGAE